MELSRRDFVYTNPSSYLHYQFTTLLANLTSAMIPIHDLQKHLTCLPLLVVCTYR